MPQLRQYKSGSIIYFEGERKSNFAFLLKQGKCTRSKLSLQTGLMESSPLVEGEFFGIKAAMGILPRDETIRVSSDAIIYIFTPHEFVEIISKNVSIIFKMLKAFSNELRNIHHAIEDILKKESDVSEDEGYAAKLNNIGLYYLKKQSYPQAKYIFQKLLDHHSENLDRSKIEKQLGTIESIINEGSNSTVAHEDFAPSQGDSVSSSPKVNESNNSTSGASEILLDPEESLQTETGDGEFVPLFNELVNAYKAKDFNGCNGFVDRMNSAIKSPYTQIHLFEKFYLIKSKVAYFNNAYTQAIELSKEFIKNYPKSPWVWNGLLVIAESMLKNANVDTAKLVYSKILSSGAPGDVQNVIQNRMQQLG